MAPMLRSTIEAGMARAWAFPLAPHSPKGRIPISCCQSRNLTFCGTFSSTYQVPVQKPLPSQVHKTMLQKNLNCVYMREGTLKYHSCGSAPPLFSGVLPTFWSPGQLSADSQHHLVSRGHFRLTCTRCWAESQRIIIAAGAKA